MLGYQDAEAAGTGMVLTSSGDVLTNNHVIDGATSITVTVVSSGATYTATVVGTDPSADVAVVHLDDASGLATAALSTSPATVGEAVTAVGNAGGTGTLSAAIGTVTGLDQSITATDSTGSSAEQLSGLIETDAGVQPGDSGGPLYGADGAIVGIDTAASSVGAAQAYAIPISTAEGIATQIEQGVTSATIEQGYPAFLGVSVGDGQGGVTVLGVVPDGPAASAGMTAGDVITAVGSQSVASAADLNAALAGHSPGQQVTVTWSDATGGVHSAAVTLGTGPAR
jgi:S1-C subfamily serine protease